MKKAAEDAGFQVTGLRDLRVPLAEWNQAVQVSDELELMQMPAVDEEQVAAFGGLNHIPTSVVTRCGKMHPWPILGVMPNVAWLEVLHARAAQLRSATCC